MDTDMIACADENRRLNIEVCERFFEAIQRLKDDRTLAGLQTFCNRYGYDRRNVYAQRKNSGRGFFKPSWLVHLSEDYGVNPTWLLLGKGAFYRRGFDVEKARSQQILCKKERRKSKSSDNQ